MGTTTSLTNPPSSGPSTGGLDGATNDPAGLYPGLLLKKKTKKKIVPPTSSTLSAAQVDAIKMQIAQRATGAMGRSSTILTSPLGDVGEFTSTRKTLLGR